MKISIFKLIVLVFMFLAASALSVNMAYALSYEGVHTIGSADFDEVIGMATDTTGNLYSVGYFAGTIDFDDFGGIDSHTSGSAYDLFILKYNVDDTYGWVRHFGGGTWNDGQGIAVDSHGDVIVVGDYKGIDVNFNDAGGADLHSSEGSYDILITKYYSDGSYGWSRTFGSTGNDKGFKVVLDDADNIYITGYFQNTVNFDASGGTDSHVSNGDMDIFITKYNANGSYGWTRTIGGTGTDAGYSIAFGKDDTLCMTGTFSGSNVSFNGADSAAIYSSNGQTDVFVTCYKTDGSYVRTYAFGGTGSDSGQSVTIDNEGAVYVVGDFSGTDIDFNPGGETSLHSAIGSTDSYISKFLSDGTYGWTRHFGGASADKVSDVSAVGSALYMTGYFSGTDTNFDNSGGTDLHTAQGLIDPYVVKYRTDSSYAWGVSFGGGSIDYGRILSMDATGNLYVGGEFQGTNANFDGTGGADLRSAVGAYDAYIATYFDDILPPDISLQAILPDPIQDTPRVLAGLAEDTYGIVTAVQFQVDSTDGTWFPCAANDGFFDSASEKFTCDINSVLDIGSHTIYVRATDDNQNTTEKGNEAKDSFVIYRDQLPQTGASLSALIIAGIDIQCVSLLARKLISR